MMIIDGGTGYRNAVSFHAMLVTDRQECSTFSSEKHLLISDRMEHPSGDVHAHIVVLRLKISRSHCSAGKTKRCACLRVNALHIGY